MSRKRHTRIVSNKRYVWFADRLRELALDLQPRIVSLEEIPDLRYDCWFDGKAPSIWELVPHIRKIQKADLSFPVILNDEGQLMDGGHRCCKAILEGAQTIKAVRFAKTPDPDRIEDLL